MDYLKEERKLWKKGGNLVVGLDEAGRGPLAGPVTACAFAVLWHSRFKISRDLRGIRDSKKLTPLKREEFYKILKNDPGVEWGVSHVSEKVIDKMNIFEATKLSMERAVKNLDRKLKKRIKFLIIDGNFEINLSFSQKSIVRADEKVFSVMAASIVAKVVRDRKMKQLHKKYPRYHFDLHKGYPTRAHFALLKKYGPCKVHRKTFKPVCRLIKNH